MSTYVFASASGEARFDEADLVRIGAGAVSDVFRLGSGRHAGLAIKLYKETASVDWERIRRLAELGQRIEAEGASSTRRGASSRRPMSPPATSTRGDTRASSMSARSGRTRTSTRWR